MSKVKVGDKIRVVNPVMAFGVYYEGDVFEVESVDGDGDVTVVEHDHALLREEFEVLPKYSKPWVKGDKVRNKRTGKVVEVYAYQPTHRTVRGTNIFVSHEKGFTFIENGQEEWSHIKVRICIPEHENTEHGRAGVTNDEIGTVIKIVEDRIKVKFPSYSDKILWDGHPSDLEVVGEVDENDLSFIRAGREPGDVKKGDIVEVTGSTSGHPVGTIGEVVEIESSGSVRVEALIIGRKKAFYENHLKLIAPSDKRVDIDA